MDNMDSKENTDRAKQLLSDHQALLQSICDMRDWTCAVSEWGMPRFGELGFRLAVFRDALSQHFSEEESGKYFRVTPGPEAQMMMVFCDQHQQLLERLDRLIGFLRAPEPKFRSWQAAVEQVESLINDICDHEQQETVLLQSAKADASA